MTDSLSAWQETLGEWTDQTFPGERIKETLDHLLEEVVELQIADRTLGYAEEAADVLILLLCYAHRKGFSLAEALVAKHAINLAREWKQDADGVFRHV